MKVFDCPTCNTYSKECIIVTYNDIDPNNERLECRLCSWSGKWADMKVREVQELGRELYTDYRVLHSDKTRLQMIGSSCPHCGGDDPLCWCKT